MPSHVGAKLPITRGKAVMTSRPVRNASDKPPPGRSGAMRLGWALGIVAIVVGLGFVALRTDTGQALLGHWTFVKYIEQDHGTYYRLKVKLTYKGEPQDFDIVVGCNVRQVIYKDNSRTYEAGLVPTVFGRRLSDGKALVVRPPNACQGETTANGRVQPDLLPVLIVYEDATALSFGTAYLSEDAYESPLSVLKFDGATIEKATPSEFAEFRKLNTNVVTPELYHSTLDSDQMLKELKISRTESRWAYMCESYERYRIPQEIVPLVDKSWPPTKPEYWVADYDAERKIGDQIGSSGELQTDHQDSPSRPFRTFVRGDGVADLGLATRSGGGLVFGVRGNWLPPSFYPTSNDFRLDRQPANRRDWPAYLSSHPPLAEIDVDFRAGETRGFAYCYVRARAGDPDILKEMGAQRVLARVDRTDVVTSRTDFFPPQWIFQRDEYAFFFGRVYLGSPRGGV